MSVYAPSFLEKAASLFVSCLFLKGQQLIFSDLSQPQISHSASFSWVTIYTHGFIYHIKT